MLAYYCSSVVGDGTSPDTAYRSYISQQLQSQGVQSSVAEAIKEDASGKPTAVQTLCCVGAPTANQSAIAADANNFQLPFSPAQLDVVMSSAIGSAAFSAMNTALLSRGFNVSGWVITDSCRKVIDGLLAQLGTGQTSQNFTATDFSG